MTTTTLAFSPDKAVTVKVKGGTKQRQQRLVWTCDKLRIRADITVPATGRASESWAVWVGSTLYALGPSLKASDLCTALRETSELSRLEAETVAREWLGQVQHAAHESLSAATAWARSKRG